MLIARRLGTDLMIHLLTSPHLSLFLGLLNNCYTQLSGKPLHRVEPMVKVQERESKRKLLEAKVQEREERRAKRRKHRGGGPTTNVTLDEPGALPQIAPGADDTKDTFRRPPVYIEIVRNRMFYGKWGFRGNKRLPGVGLPVSRQYIAN
jgi:hypothetical protein